jgi:hypothetical protein
MSNRKYRSGGQRMQEEKGRSRKSACQIDLERVHPDLRQAQRLVRVLGEVSEWRRQARPRSGHPIAEGSGKLISRIMVVPETSARRLPVGRCLRRLKAVSSGLICGVTSRPCLRAFLSPSGPVLCGGHGA